MTALPQQADHRRRQLQFSPWRERGRVERGRVERGRVGRGRGTIGDYADEEDGILYQTTLLIPTLQLFSHDLLQRWPIPLSPG